MTDTDRDDETGYPNPRYAWYVVSVLTVAYLLSFLDRQILALLVEPIRRDLEISDFQVSLLGNLAFGIFYTVLGLPLGRAADRFSRRGIIAAGVTIWCVHDRRLRPGPQLRPALPRPGRRGRRRSGPEPGRPLA